MNNKTVRAADAEVAGNVLVKRSDGMSIGSANDNKNIPPQVRYNGYVLFENLKGTASQEKEWRKEKINVYKGSQMHFLRALLSNSLDEEGFRVLLKANYNNPQLLKFILNQ